MFDISKGDLCLRDFFFLSIVAFCCVLWPGASAIVIPIAPEGNAYYEVLDAAVSQAVALDACIFETIGFVEKAELSYLVGLNIGMRVTAVDLKKAAASLQAKRAFAVIELGIEPSGRGGIRIRWHLERCWLVDSVKMHGNIIGRQAYRALYALEPGDPFDQKKHEEAVTAILDSFKREGYGKAQVVSNIIYDDSCMMVVVHLTLKRGLYTGKNTIDVQPLASSLVQDASFKNYIFKGNAFFSHDDLMALVLAFGESAPLVPGSIIADEIEHAYHAKGFWDVSIQRFKSDDDWVFVISEGQRARLAKVKIQSKKKNAVVLTKDYFSEVISQEFIDEQVVHDAIERLLAGYVQDGFFDVLVTQLEYVLQEDNLYDLCVMICEGEQSSLVAIQIPAYKDLEEIVPYADCLASGKVACTIACIQKQQEWLVGYFRALGYERSDIKPEYQRDGTKVTLIWHIDPGKKVVFGKTIVLGNGSLPINYVLRELAYKHGTRFDAQAIKKSLKRLKELELFDCIRISPCCMDDVNELERMLLLRVYSDTKCQLSTRAGFGLQQFTRDFTFSGITYNVGGTCLIKNPFSIADRLCIDAESAFGYRNFSVSYRMPWLGSLPVRTLVQGYAMRYQYPGITDCEQRLYEVDQAGVLLGFAKKYQAYDGALTMGVERMRLSVNTVYCPGVCSVHDLARALCINPVLFTNPTVYAQAEPTLFIDYLDNRLQPTRGSLTMLSAKVMVPLIPEYGRQWFAKFVIDESFFLPVLPCVFAGRVRLGHIVHAGLRDCMPTERFYLGGANSLRSYSSDLCPPLGTFTDTCGHGHKVARGGCSMVTINAELRFPLYKQLGGVVFQDFGVLWADVYDDWYGRPLMASGFGLRYATPIGPLRFDIGWKWKRHYPEDVGYAWFLTFGHAF